MVSVFDVAKYILEEKGRMSTWKLQKLCYYAQAWHFTWTGKPLFKERIEAWTNGPVCPPLYHAHVGKFSVTTGDILRGNPSKLNEDESESVDVVLKDYGDRDPHELKEMTHAEDPWKNARGNLPEDAKCTREITLECMKKYYSERMK